MTKDKKGTPENINIWAQAPSYWLHTLIVSIGAAAVYTEVLFFGATDAAALSAGFGVAIIGIVVPVLIAPGLQKVHDRPRLSLVVTLIAFFVVNAVLAITYVSRVFGLLLVVVVLLIILAATWASEISISHTAMTIWKRTRELGWLRGHRREDVAWLSLAAIVAIVAVFAFAAQYIDIGTTPNQASVSAGATPSDAQMERIWALGTEVAEKRATAEFILGSSIQDPQDIGLENPDTLPWDPRIELDMLAPPLTPTSPQTDAVAPIETPTPRLDVGASLPTPTLTVPLRATPTATFLAETPPSSTPATFVPSPTEQPSPKATPTRDTESVVVSVGQTPSPWIVSAIRSVTDIRVRGKSPEVIEALLEARLNQVIMASGVAGSPPDQSAADDQGEASSIAEIDSNELRLLVLYLSAWSQVARSQVDDSTITSAIVTPSPEAALSILNELPQEPVYFPLNLCTPNFDDATLSAIVSPQLLIDAIGEDIIWISLNEYVRAYAALINSWSKASAIVELLSRDITVPRFVISDGCVIASFVIPRSTLMSFTPEKLFGPELCLDASFVTGDSAKIGQEMTEEIAELLLEYNPKLKGLDNFIPDALFHEPRIDDPRFDSASGKYCGRLSGYVIPVEIQAAIGDGE